MTCSVPERCESIPARDGITSSALLLEEIDVSASSVELFISSPLSMSCVKTVPPPSGDSGPPMQNKWVSPRKNILPAEIAGDDVMRSQIELRAS